VTRPGALPPAPYPDQGSYPVKTLLAMPRYSGTVNMEAAGAFFRSASADSVLNPEGFSPAGSLLPTVFNVCWSRARTLYRRGECTHFAMVHADMGAPPGWIDTLHEQMQLANVDLISAVVPIKDMRGLTSTAIDDTGDPWRVRRLTLKEVDALPETFTDEDLGGKLLVNTGLWLCRLGDWCRKVCFRQQDCIIEQEDGQDAARTIPEDWDFSRQLKALGVRIAATKAVRVKHYGEMPFASWEKWGWDTDEANGQHPAAVEARARKAERNGASDHLPASLARA
jgi:hypothetical protein